ncbi:hypothetical protein VTO73DRAFT_4077 [Trametes versicolor]
MLFSLCVAVMFLTNGTGQRKFHFTALHIYGTISPTNERGCMTPNKGVYLPISPVLAADCPFTNYSFLWTRHFALKLSMHQKSLSRNPPVSGFERTSGGDYWAHTPVASG